jgi:hypothetical protein
MGRASRAAALALLVALVASPALAQTVILRGLTAGTPADLVLNSTTLASATANDKGDATITPPAGSGVTADIDANLFVDVCADRHRVVLVSRGASPLAQAPGCQRQEISGLFLVRPVTTMLVDVTGGRASLFLRQGPLDPDAPVPTSDAIAPAGLILFGGAGLNWFDTSSQVACGTAPTCENDGTDFGYTAGGAVWFIPYVGVEAAWVRPGDETSVGGGLGYRFNSVVESDVITLAGIAGVPTGKMRIFGKGGVSYHRAAIATTQTIDDKTITIDGVEEVIVGGTQTLGYRTSGWGWVFGGGLEFWFSRNVAIYGEFAWITLDGTDRDGGEAVLDDRVITVFAGARVRLGR